MSDSIHGILALEDDSELIDRLFDRIVDQYGNGMDVSKLREGERVVILVWHAFGVIGNGGFDYLFEGIFNGDPQFLKTAAAFATIGCLGAREAFQKALALFPDGVPPADVGQRLRLYRSGPASRRGPIDEQFFHAMEEIKKFLAAYIRRNRQAFEQLATPTDRQEPEEPVASSEEGDGSAECRDEGPLSSLPHWARVAFAARCGRRVWPLFLKHWPNALPKRVESVHRAIELAERSAELGKAVTGSKEAVINAAVTAGAALAGGLYGYEWAQGAENEPMPADGNAASAASRVAKVAECAARAAAASSEESLGHALSALTWASPLLGPKTKKRLRRDLARLRRAIQLYGWDDNSPVAPAVFRPDSRGER